MLAAGDNDELASLRDDLKSLLAMSEGKIDMLSILCGTKYREFQYLNVMMYCHYMCKSSCILGLFEMMSHLILT